MGAIYWVQHCGLETYQDKKEFEKIDVDSLLRVKDLQELLPPSQELQEPASQHDTRAPPNDPE